MNPPTGGGLAVDWRPRGLPPIEWTLSERRIRCPTCKQRREDGHDVGSPRSSRPGGSREASPSLPASRGIAWSIASNFSLNQGEAGKASAVTDTGARALNCSSATTTLFHFL